MSTEQTNSSKGKIQIPEGWSPTSIDEKIKSPKPINVEEETKFREIPEEDAINEMTPNCNVTQESESSIGANDTIQPEERNNTADSLQTELVESIDATHLTVPKRITGKQQKESLEEYRETFLQVLKLEDRKPVFISREVRDSLDEIARKLGGRGMSVSALLKTLLGTIWNFTMRALKSGKNCNTSEVSLFSIETYYLQFNLRLKFCLSWTKTIYIWVNGKMC